MDTNKLKFTKLQNGIFSFLSENSGERFSQREIARKLSVSPTAISKALKLLEKEKLIKSEKEKGLNRSFISVNRDNQNAVDLKRVENLKAIYQSGIINFLSEDFPGCTIILFGSYSKGEDTKGSDIDLAIIGTKNKQTDLTKFEKLMNKEINLNFYKTWNIDKHLKNNILNGIVLSGGIEL